MTKSEVKTHIKQLLNRNNPVILDVGMYDGADAREFAKLIPDSTIHGFECDPRSIALFKSFKNPYNIHLNEIALGSKNKQVPFYMSDSETRRHYNTQSSWSASSSLRKPKTHIDLFPDVFFKETTKVDCQTLDSWCIKNKVHYIDIAWVDVNGAEYDFVLGGIKILNTSTRYIYIEFSDKELYEGQKTKKDLLKALFNFEEIGVYGFEGNFGNLLLKNKTL